MQKKKNTEKNLEEVRFNWKTEISEPILNCCLKFLDNPMIASNFLFHSQSVEHILQEVTKASMMLDGAEKRDGFIRATLAQGKLMSLCASQIKIY